MDRSLVKRLAALRNPQEADALFKCLSSEAWYFPYILAGLEAIVLLTVFHDIFADCRGQACNMFQKRMGGCIHVDTYPVDRRFHDKVQRFCKIFLIHI